MREERSVTKINVIDEVTKKIEGQVHESIPRAERSHRCRIRLSGIEMIRVKLARGSVQ